MFISSSLSIVEYRLSISHVKMELKKGSKFHDLYYFSVFLIFHIRVRDDLCWGFVSVLRNLIIRSFSFHFFHLLASFLIWINARGG